MWEIRKERHKIALLLFFCFTIFGLILFLGEKQLHQYLEKIVARQQEALFQLAGAEVQGQPAFYALTQVVKGEKDQTLIMKGKAAFLQAGYSDRYLRQQETCFQEFQNQFFWFACILLGTASISICMLRRAEKQKHQKELLLLIEHLEQFRAKNYTAILPNLQEGIYADINGKLILMQEVLRADEQRLEQEKEAVKSLVTDISHQLKTPLASLKTCFSLIMEEELTVTEQNEFMERSLIQISRLEQLIGALLQISRLEIGMITLHKEWADLIKTIQDAAELVASKAKEKQITIYLQDTRPFFLWHDTKWTAEAIANVLDNDIKYSPKGSQIIIRIYEKITFLQIEIEDEGIGIATEEQHKIFQRFYRGSTPEVKTQEGTGVGLYLTRKIMEDQGGTVWVKSRKEIEKGTKFLLQLPLH